MNPMSRRTYRVLAVSLLATVLHGTAMAAPVTGTWIKASGGATMGLTNTTTASPTWGDGTTDNADASSIYSPFSTITLANPGDKVVLSGSVEMFGISPGTAGSIFRFGLFNVNGSATNNGWLGYFVQSAASAGTGSLQERALVNTTSFTSTSGGGSASIQTLPVATSALTSAVYDFSFTLERATPISPPSGPSQWLFQGPPAESKFLAAALVGLGLEDKKEVVAFFLVAFG
jgi:hypothetical protein